MQALVVCAARFFRVFLDLDEPAQLGERELLKLRYSLAVCKDRLVRLLEFFWAFLEDLD